MALIIKTTGWDDYMDPAGGSWIKQLILGAPDVGKTRSASFWPKPIFADCEDGRMSLADRAVPYGRIRSTADMDALINQLQFDCKRPPEKRKYLTFVIDTIDHYQKIAISERLKSEGKEALSGWADWGWLDGHMQQFIEKLLNLDMNIIVNCHLKDVTVDDPTDDDKKISMKQLRLKGDVKEWLLEEFDLIGHMETSYKAEGGERIRRRMIRWHNEPSFPILKDRSGSLPRFTDIDFTEGDYNRIFEALMSKVDALPASTDVETIEVPEEPEPAGPDVTGGPVDVGNLPEKRVAAKKAVAKKVGKKAAEAAKPGEAIVTPEVGTKDAPLIVDANKVDLAKVYHAHAKSGECLKNRFGDPCETPGEAETETPASPEPSTDVTKSEEAAPNTETPESAPAEPAEPAAAEPEPAVALVKEELGGEVISEETREEVKPDKYCGKQPDSHKKFSAVEGCGKDLATEIPAKVNLALLRAKTMLCTNCFETWKTASAS